MAEDNKTHRAEDKFESSKTHARKAAEDLRSAAAGAVAEEYRGKAEEAWGDARARPSKSGAMRAIVPARCRKMASNTCAKIRPKRS